MAKSLISPGNQRVAGVMGPFILVNTKGYVDCCAFMFKLSDSNCGADVVSERLIRKLSVSKYCMELIVMLMMTNSTSL